MRGLWITFGPMLAAAALMLWGGERLARRTVEDRIPADRTRLFDFTDALRGELDRLDELYADHLSSIAQASIGLDQKTLTRRCENLVGLRSCNVFVASRKEAEIRGVQPLTGPGSLVPTVIAEGDARVVSRNLVPLPQEILAGRDPATGWLHAPERGFTVHWIRTQPARVIAFVIDETELDQELQRYFTSWLESSLSPLREAGELVAIEGPGGHEWLAPPPDSRTGPAALLLPHRIRLGEWQVLAWDKLKIRTTHDPTTLIVSGIIACALLLTAIVLQIQQGRALRLAEERVSFVNRVSHELGTPLTNILLNLDIASRSLETRPADARRRLALVHEEVRRLGRLVSNVLTFSRGERKTLELASTVCVPDEVIEAMLAQFQPSFDRRNVRVEWQRGASDHTKLDPDALAQIAGNLISNVEKYASAGGWLGLTTVMKEDRLKLRVSDHGPGIPPRCRGRIFEAFERVHTGVSEGSSGTGLGLAIARDLARRMGGDLVLIPTEKGAVFELELPAPSTLTVVHSEVA